MRRTSWLIVAASLAAAACPGQQRAAQTPKLPAGYSVPQIARSPDGRYGVLVPDLKHYDWAKEQNRLVDLRTGRVLAVIHAHSGAVGANHVDIEKGNWSPDGSLFLWRVAGKWCPTALVLLKVDGGKVAWQLDVLDAAQQAILTRTRKAKPGSYRAAVKQNEGNGPVYPDGFTVDVTVNVEPGQPLKLPLKVTATLTSNPKMIPDYPKAAQLDSVLSGAVSADGKFRVAAFCLTKPQEE